jgi:predicted alpha/beta-hydrolase family hydrolase
MKLHTRKVFVDDETQVSCTWGIPEAFHGDVFALAHGAGNDMNSPFLSFIHESLADSGILTVKFNFPYKELGRKAPDRGPRLEQTWRAVLQQIRTHSPLPAKRIFTGGKSMGGRIASMVAAKGESLAGLVFLGYPLHPANKPDQLRVEHLRDIKCPMLFIQGSRDRLCDLGLLEDAINALTTSVQLHVIEQGDHSFKVPKRTGRSEQDIWNEISQTICTWMRQI